MQLGCLEFLKGRYHILYCNIDAFSIYDGVCRPCSADKQGVTCHRQAMFNIQAYNHYLVQIGLYSPRSTVIILSIDVSHWNKSITIGRTKILLPSRGLDSFYLRFTNQHRCTNCFGSLGCRDRRFECYSRHGCLCVRLFYVCVVLCR
jgi:hypothetical protein